MSDDLLKTGFDPNRRELCPDGACIGVIGSDGNCKECGTPSPNGPPPAETEIAAETPETPERSPDADDELAPARAVSNDERAAEGDSFDPTKRELCPDGACIGVIGPDGTCRECGRAAE